MDKILRLNVSGTPTHWLSREEAVLQYAKGLVRWEYGDDNSMMFGGINRHGAQSSMAIRAVIATSGTIHVKRRTSFNNIMLFKRDDHRCMYCGRNFRLGDLSRDHVFPRARGGKDIWENVVASCKRCNHAKADRTPEEAGMPLLAVPFRPNIFEAMYLSQHVVLADQMDYLSKQFSRNREWKAA
jgi:5-methylcytosine-specific restriction endonuclease McrA